MDESMDRRTDRLVFHLKIGLVQRKSLTHVKYASEYNVVVCNLMASLYF